MMEAYFKRESNAEYHGNKDAVSKSSLARLSICPQYFKFLQENPPPKTDDLIFGSLFHKIVLEPSDLESEFVVAPAFDRRTKAGREAYAEFCESVEERDVVTAEMMAVAEAMRDSVLANPRARKLLTKNVTVEESVYFFDELTEEALKCRPDARKALGGRTILTDLKSCRSASEKAFTRDAERYGYDLQAYLYRKGVSQALEIPPSEIDFVFVAVEKTPPYLINIFLADETFLASGEVKYREYVDTYHYCRETGNWYGLNGKDNEILKLTIGGNKDE
jgi:hypothetical protein